MRKKLLWTFFITLSILSMLSVSMIGVTVAQEAHDIAVTSVMPSQTLVRLGELVNITVVIENQGTSGETFNVTLHHDNTAIETKTVQNLAAGLNTSLTFAWNTTDVREEVYAARNPQGKLAKEKTFALNATASTVPGETDTADNTLSTYPAGVKVIAHYIAVIPQTTVDPTLTPGNNYTISIYTDYNGSDVWGWQFILTYNPDILEGIEVVNGDLITEAKDPSATFHAGTFNNTLGELSLTTAFFFYIPPAPAPTTSGPGTLASVTFRVKGTGDTNITLIETQLRNSTETIIDFRSPWLGHLLPGYFRNTEEEVIHDVAVLSVKPSNTSVLEGEPVNITVVVKNNGTITETFDVEVWYDYDPLGTPSFRRIGTENVSNLAAGATKTLTFIWNTTGVTAGKRTITAVAETLPGENDQADNVFTSDEKVTVIARSPPPIPIREILIAIVVIVAIIAVVMYAVRRRKKPMPE